MMALNLDKILTIMVSGVRPQEHKAVCELISECNLHVGDITIDKLKNFLLARKGDQIIGVIGLEVAQPYGLIRSLAVDESFRGRGVAKRLVQAIENYARSRNLETLYLLTMTAETFFMKLGYKSVGRTEVPGVIQATHEFTHLCPQRAACLCKTVEST
jgi:amino-acid N-acetyltransferase